MAFLKVERKASGTYLRIAESYRNQSGKPSSRVLYSIGKVEDYTPEQLRHIGVRLFELGGGDVKALLDGEVFEKVRYNYGYVWVLSKAMQHYGLADLLRRVSRKSKLKFDLRAAILLMLVERLHDPCSKRSNWNHRAEYIGLPALSLHHLYRALDGLAKHTRLIQQQIFQTGRDLFNQQLDVVFYDVTTLYFESETEHPDELRQFGFSKDGKIGNTQILFCMLIDRQKNPISYRIFKGNTFEGHTLQSALEDLKTQYHIDKIVVVADRGMLSKNNLEQITTRGYEFIMGERIKSLPQAVQTTLLDLSQYKYEWIYTDHQDQNVVVQYTTLQHEGKTIIATYSDKRAAKDRHDREQKIETANHLLKQPSLIAKKASRFYLTAKGDQQYELNSEKIKSDQAYDGILAIATNNTSLGTADILDHYKQLYKIEHTFRTFKHHLEIRPMFHWTDRRIEGHICLCYIAYTLQHFILQKASQLKTPLTENSLRQMLDAMQLSLLQHNENEIYIRSKPHEQEGALLQLLGIKPLLPLTAKDKLQLPQ